MKRRLLVLSFIATTGCALRAHSGADVQIDAVRPDSVMVASGVVVEVLVKGHGFAPGTPGRNTVVFGSYAVNAVPANADGTEIRFVIPERLPSGSEAPPAQLEAGSYEIRVRNATGESNVATVRVFR